VYHELGDELWLERKTSPQPAAPELSVSKSAKGPKPSRRSPTKGL
jgi:hypothetical protein